MKEQITIRLYENAAVPSCCHTGKYEPDGVTGWDLSTGDTVPLTEKIGGGRVFGVVEAVEDEVHADEQNHRYKLAVIWTQD